MLRPITLILAGALAVGLVFPRALAAQDAAPPPAEAQPAEPAPDLLEVQALELRVLALPDADLAGLAAARLTELQDAAQSLVDAAIELARVQQAAAAAEQADTAGIVEALDARVAERRAVVQRTATELDTLLDAQASRKTDVAAARNYLDSVTRLLAAIDAGQPGSPLPPEPDQEPTIEQRVAAEARRIQSDPPVHERAEPWNVPVTEFLNELQPLRKEQIEERVGKWIDLLQGEIRKRNRLTIAAEQATDPVLRQALLDAAEQQTGIIRRVAERTEVALKALELRGGDVTEQRRYIRSATEIAVDISNLGVLYSRAFAWLRSPDGGIQLGLRVATFLGIVLAFGIAAGITGRVVSSAVRRLPKASNLLREFLAGGASRLVLIIGFVVALSQLGVNIGPLVAAIGAAGLVIGLALQGTLSNFASGILILIYRPYDVGDFIDAGGVSGKVEVMNLVSTRIATFDNQVRFVPNNEIWGGVITNINGRDTRRVDMTFGIGYDDDIAAAEAIIRDVVTRHPKVLASPEPLIKLNELADNSVNFIVRPWAKVADYWDVYWDVTRSIKERFDAEGVGIPFPQRDVHLSGPLEIVMKNA